MTQSSDPLDAGSEYLPLCCQNCFKGLGKFYLSTPKHLSYRLNLYNINNTAIKSYKLGENLQQMIPPSQAPITLETCQHYEEECRKQRVLLMMFTDNVSKLEEVLFPSLEDS
ncbi:hypothetical protein PRIEUP_LOCUS1594 [Pristimantis euphronides]